MKASILKGILLTSTVALAGAVQADVMEDIKERGVLIVGTKADYKPYGYLDEKGEIIGLEPDLAKDIADRMGVKVEFVPVVSSNRMQFVDQGKIDIMIATMTDKPDRRKVVNIVDPNYYSSGTNLLAWKKVGFKSWDDLKGKKICGIQGAFYNKPTQQKYGAEIVAFKGTSEALTALKQGNCLALVYDDSFIASKLSDPEWSAEFEMPVETIDDAPWGIAVKNGEDKFRDYISEIVIDWHKSGKLLELEKKYGIKNTPFVIDLHEKYMNAKDGG